MPINNYTYPRVTTSINALKHTNVVPTAEDTTNLFMPLVTKMGPVKTVTRVHSLAEFISIFGELDYETNGTSAMITYNWLTNGGTIYAYRLQSNTGYAVNAVATTTTIEAAGEGEEATTVTTYSKGAFKAKYPGKEYSALKVRIVFNTNRNFNVSISMKKGNKTTLVESFPMINVDNYKRTLLGSSYIQDFDFVGEDLTKLTNEGFKKGDVVEYSANAVLYGESYGTTWNYDDDQITLLQRFWGFSYSEGEPVYIQDEYSECYNALGNHLETPIDCLMDAAYPMSVKKGMMAFIASDETKEVGVRTDIYAYFEDIDLWKQDNGKYVPSKNEVINDHLFDEDDASNEDPHFFVFHDYFIATDNIFTDQDLVVGLNYFLSSMVPYNDLTNGIFRPLAGENRAVLTGCKGMGKNPTPAEKETLFTKRLNYVEKTPNQYILMAERTHDGSTFEEFTSLSFIYRVRVTEKIKKEIEKLARRYLYEFNDSVTLTQMSNVLNKYVAEWIPNVLISGEVKVSQADYSDEVILLDLYIKFKSAVELIHAQIVVD